MGNTPRGRRSPRRPFPTCRRDRRGRFATASAGVRYAGRDDVMLVHLAPGTAMAGVFTRSTTRSAAVLDCQDKIGGAPKAGRRSW